MQRGVGQNSGFSDIFIGRQQELSLLNAALDEAAANRGQIVMLTGEPGIGKTTLAEKIVEEAASRGHTTLHGACFDGDYSPPLWLWTQVLRSALESPGGDEAFAQLTQRQQSLVASIVPELNVPGAENAIVEFESSTSPHVERGRFELHDSITRYLGIVTRKTPTIVWLDDLHWADNSDLAFLEFASQQLAASPIMILGSYRDTDVTRNTPLASSLGHLTRLKGFRRIQLSGLTAGEMEQLIQQSTPVRLDRFASSRLVERADGNPLFGRELAHGISETDRANGRANDAIERLPEGIAEAIGMRIAGIDATQLEVLHIAAVIGVEFTQSELQASMGPASVAIESAVDAASNGSLIKEMPSSPGTYRFTHALIQETLQDELTPTQLVRTHARIATALASLPNAKDSSRLSAVARHFREGVLALDLNEAIEHSVRAGEHALAIFSFAEAADHLGWAAESAEDKSDSAERASILERFAVATLQSNPPDPQPGWDNLCESVRMYIRLGMNDDAVRLASFPAVIGGMTGLVPLIEETLKITIPGSIERGWLLARYIVSLGDAGRVEEAEMAFAETIELAAKLNDERLRARALVHGAQAKYRANDPEQCVVRALEAIDLATKVGDNLGILRVLDFCVESLCAIGRTREAEERLKSSSKVKDETVDAFRHYVRAEHMLAFYRGDWNRIEKLTDELPDDRLTRNVINWRAVHTGLRLGEPETGLFEILDPSISKWDADGYHIAFNILATWLQVQPEPELQELCEQIGYNDPIITAEGNTRLKALMLMLSVLRGEEPDSKAIETMQTSLSQVVPRTDIPIERILGIVSMAAGGYEQSRGHFETSVNFCRQAEFWPALAWSLFDLIRLEEKRPGTVDFDRVQSASGEALKLCDDLEMSALAVLIRDSLNRVAEAQTAIDGKTALPDSLSEREVQVLKQIATGRSNQEIADELSISRYTVIRHVSNIFQKSGASNRTEAAAYAHQHGLS